VSALILYAGLHPATPRPIIGAVMSGSPPSKVVATLLLLCALLGVSARRGYFAAPSPPVRPDLHPGTETAAIATTPIGTSTPMTRPDDAGYLILPFPMTTD
jgi:hypothetical protein